MREEGLGGWPATRLFGDGDFEEGNGGILQLLRGVPQGKGGWGGFTIAGGLAMARHLRKMFLKPPKRHHFDVVKEIKIIIKSSDSTDPISVQPIFGPTDRIRPKP